MYGSAEACVCVVMLSLIAFISDGTWKLELPLQGGKVMATHSMGTECGTLGRR